MELYRLLFCSLIVLYATQSYSGVTNLTVKFRKGKTYITWKEEAGDNKTYHIYRSKTKITSVVGLNPIVRVNQGSSYDSRFKKRYVIEDLKSPLNPGTGLFVYTPSIDGIFYYAITVLSSNAENKSITIGTNSLSTPVAEKHWQWPQGILQKFEHGSNRDVYTYFHWMDYFDWPNKYDYYGEYYTVTIEGSYRSGSNLPLHIYLHGVTATKGYFMPASARLEKGAINVGVLDNWVPNATYCHTWWVGVSNHYGEHDFRKGDTIVDYTSQRIVQYIQSLKLNPRFSVDTNRVYIAGGSMGGYGTYQIGLHYPEIFAALRPVIAARIDARGLEYGGCAIEGFAGYWGSRELGLPAPNGIKAFRWNRPTWVLANNQSTDFPPIIDFIGSRDRMFTHTYLYQIAAEFDHGMWGVWHDVAHDEATFKNLDGVPGSWWRFVKNEVYPAFSNSTTDDNYGHVSKFDSDYVPQSTSFSGDAAGIMNGYIDWTSSRHDMGLHNDNLIDTEKMLSITFKSSRSKTIVDITPRRIQKFPVIKGKEYDWKNINVDSGRVIASGIVRPDMHGVLTVKRFAVSTTGNTLIITSNFSH